MFLTQGWRHFRSTICQNHSMWHFFFSPNVTVSQVFGQWHYWNLDKWGAPPSSLFWDSWGSTFWNFWRFDSKFHSSYAHRSRAQFVSDFHWQRRVCWRQPYETASARMATIFALKPLGHEGLRVKSFVTWTCLRYLDDQKFGVLPAVLPYSAAHAVGRHKHSDHGTHNELPLTAPKNWPQQLSVTSARKTNSFYWYLHRSKRATLPRKCHPMSIAAGIWDGWTLGGALVKSFESWRRDAKKICFRDGTNVHRPVQHINFLRFKFLGQRYLGPCQVRWKPQPRRTGASLWVGWPRIVIGH